ncbi:MAG: hypothetical protein NWQ13_07940 [Glaciimonas sp.]|nr:hypothetical protein [Glaciimonas sp.]
MNKSIICTGVLSLFLVNVQAAECIGLHAELLTPQIARYGTVTVQVTNYAQSIYNGIIRFVNNSSPDLQFGAFGPLYPNNPPATYSFGSFPNPGQYTGSLTAQYASSSNNGECTLDIGTVNVS